jgi:hypothetical protein
MCRNIIFPEPYHHIIIPSIYLRRAVLQLSVGKLTGDGGGGAGGL